MKKFIVTLLVGAFLFTSLAATIGCSEEKKPEKEKDKAKAADKDKKDK